MINLGKMALAILVMSGSLQASCCGASETGTDEALHFKIAADQYLRQGLISESITEYHKAIRINPHCRSAYFNLAIAYYQRRDLENAARVLEDLVALKPGDTEAHYNLACLKIYLGDPAGARQHFERAQCGDGFDGRLASLIEQGLEFLAELGVKNPSTQDLVLFLIRQGLPPL